MNRKYLSILPLVLLSTAFLALPVRRMLAQQNQSVEFIHTGDWQPGDNVSFTIRGVVVDSQADSKPAQEQGSSFTGHVVELSDSKGKKTKLPWAPLLRLVVPQSTGYLTATLLDPKGKKVAVSTIPVCHANSPTAVTMLEPPVGNVVVPPLSQAGQPYRIISPGGRLSGDGAITKLIARRANEDPVEYPAVAASPRAAIFMPAKLQPGPHIFTVKEGSKFEEAFRVQVLGIRLDTSRIYKVGQKGTLVVEVTGLPTAQTDLHGLMPQAPLVTVVNRNPAILAFTDEPQRLTRNLLESEVHAGRWFFDIAVLAVARGQFEITSTVSTLGYVNSGTARPPVLFKGPDPADAKPGPATKPADTKPEKPGDARPPEKTGDPGAKPPTVPENNSQPQKICGPDVTNNYLAQLKIIKDRLRRSRKEIDAMGHEEFMRKNGMQMDYWVGTSASCPKNCNGTLTLAGLCVYEGFTNDLMYGYIGRMLDLPLETLIAAGDVQEVMATGNVKGKPGHKVAGYATGYDLAREADITIDGIRRLLQEVFVGTGGGAQRRALDLVTEGCQDCVLCPETTSPINGRNFGAEDWKLK